MPESPEPVEPPELSLCGGGFRGSASATGSGTRGRVIPNQGEGYSEPGGVPQAPQVPLLREPGVGYRAVRLLAMRRAHPRPKCSHCRKLAICLKRWPRKLQAVL